MGVFPSGAGGPAGGTGLTLGCGGVGVAFGRAVTARGFGSVTLACAARRRTLEAFLGLLAFGSKTFAAALRAWRAAFLAALNVRLAALNFAFAARAALRAASAFISAATARAINARASIPAGPLFLLVLTVFISRVARLGAGAHRLVESVGILCSFRPPAQARECYVSPALRITC